MSENDMEIREVAEQVGHVEHVHSDQPASPPVSPTTSSLSFKQSHSPTPIDVDNPHQQHQQQREEGNDEVVVVEPPPKGTAATYKAESKSRSASAQAPPNDNLISIPPAQPEASTSSLPPPSSHAPPAQTTKPKSTKARKSRSPSPPPAPPPPLLTVRLDISLGGPDNYEVDVSSLALQTGQRNPTPPPVKRDTSDSEGEDTDDPKSKPKGKAIAGKRSRAAEYDLTDPFIDDSELAIDDRTHFAQTKQQGFYVSSGEVALMKDRSTPKKPKSTKRALVLTSAASANIQPLSHTHGSIPSSHGHPPPPLSRPRTPSHTSSSAVAAAQEGTRDSPIALLDDDDQKPPPISHGVKRKASPTSTASASALQSHDPDAPKKRRKMQLQPFSSELEASIDTLKEAIAKESFEVKGKFPPALKPKLQQLALQAIILDEYNDNFFARMPQLFPYNKFTMTKLIKRLVYADHQKLLKAKQEELLAELKELADKGMDQARSEWDRNVQNWRERKERYDADLKSAGQLKPGTASAEPSTHGDDTGDSPPPEGDGPSGPRTLREYPGKEPPKKYRLTEPMKNIFWQLYCLSNESSRLTNEKNQLEGVPDTVSEQGMRKLLYQDIIKAFPEGWMTSGNISRDISVIKKKQESEQSRFDDMNGHGM